MNYKKNSMNIYKGVSTSTYHNPPQLFNNHYTLDFVDMTKSVPTMYLVSCNLNSPEILIF